MKRVLLYSSLLLAGMAGSQILHLEPGRVPLHAVTLICLSYILIEVGLEFSREAIDLRRYAWDYLVAGTAASLPWMFVAVYFMAVLGTSPKESWLVGLFSAPTSAGVLFTMLAAAGLGATWVFKKARVLAIFDDLHTLLLMIPLQMAFIGLRWQLVAVAALSIGLLAAAYRWMNRISWPIGKPWLLVYALGVTVSCRILERLTSVHLEVLLPAFVVGCLVRHRATIEEGDDPHSWLDQIVKALFMTLVGFSLPRIAMRGMGTGAVVPHVLALTVLSNAGKCFPLFFYRREASLRERLALSVAMFPRGEVGAGVLLVALGYGIKSVPVMLGTLSLALNLLLTGGFIVCVRRLSRYRGASG